MTKTISLSDDAYDALSAIKREGESFSEVARRLAKKAGQADFWDPELRVAMDDGDAKRRSRDIRKARDDPGNRR